MLVMSVKPFIVNSRVVRTPQSVSLFLTVMRLKFLQCGSGF